jgi:predicted O-methyltransferase YrrM
MDAFESNMTNELWNKMDAYHNSFLLRKDPILDQVIANCVANGLPDIAVSAAQGKHLYLTAKSIQAKRILEVGTLGGCVLSFYFNSTYSRFCRYSTILMARALPENGELISLELEKKHVKVRNFELPGHFFEHSR